ncbi:MAG: histidine phosphatase family protein [Deltaproteobacteria bacterium]|nr:histidine phosphatase family protein [Deltaproteobacteria bacterium]
MIRHGQASFGHDNYDNLSPLGIQQAQILGEHFTRIGLNFDAVYSGAMQRQEATAQEVLACYQASGLDVPGLVQVSDLNEYDFSTIISAQIPQMIKEDPSIELHLKKMLTDKESFRRVFEGAMLRWISGNHNTPDTLSWKDFTEQITLALKAIIARHGRGSTIAVFTSGGPICAAIKWVLGLSDERAIRLNWQIVNTSYSRIMYNDERVTLAGFNSISHLELQNGQSLITYR